MTLNDESLMPFGKHKDTAMVNVPAHYLWWLFDSNRGKKPFGEASEAVQQYIMENLDAIKKELAND